MRNPTRSSSHPSRHHYLLAACLGVGACDQDVESEQDLGSEEFRLVDGSLTEEWPAVVGVSSFLGVCSGTQITDRLILTAAHCVTYLDEAGAVTELAPDEVEIYWGADPLAGLNDLPDPTLIGLRGATRIEVHPEWATTFGFSTDLALVFLDGPGYAEPLPIRTADVAASMGQMGQMVGFGTFEVGEGGLDDLQYDGRKREGMAPLVLAGSLFPEAAAYDDELYVVDGAGLATNGCYGDSGGPLLLNEGDGEVVAGVASFIDSDFCDAATFYVRVDVMQAFIDQFVDVSPVLECVDELPDGTYVAHFGYSNSAGWTVERPVGSSNNFHPSAIDRGQPEAFEPGRQVDVFTVPFTGTLVWKLGSKTSTAGAGSKRCS